MGLVKPECGSAARRPRPQTLDRSTICTCARKHADTSSAPDFWFHRDDTLPLPKAHGVNPMRTPGRSDPELKSSGVTLSMAQSPAQREAARSLITEYLRWVADIARSNYGLSFDIDAMVRSDIDDTCKFHPPTGRCYLVESAGSYVGVGCLKRLDTWAVPRDRVRGLRSLCREQHETLPGTGNTRRIPGERGIHGDRSAGRSVTTPPPSMKRNAIGKPASTAHVKLRVSQ